MSVTGAVMGPVPCCDCAEAAGTTTKHQQPGCPGRGTMKKLIVGVMLFGLCACGGSGGGDPVAGGQGPAEPGPAATTTAGDPGEVDAEDAPPPSGAAASLAAAVGGGSATNIPRQLCAFLKTEIAEAKDGTLKGLVGDFANWLSEDPGRAVGINTKLDEMTTSTCPKVRSELLKLTKRDSLDAVLGR